MSHADQLVANNQQYAESFSGPLPLPPAVMFETSSVLVRQPAPAVPLLKIVNPSAAPPAPPAPAT